MGLGGRAHARYVFRLFEDLRMSAICNRKVLFLYPGTKYGGENPLTINKVSAALNYRVTPEVTGFPSLLPLNRQRIIKSEVKMRVPGHPMSVF